MKAATKSNIIILLTWKRAHRANCPCVGVKVSAVNMVTTPTLLHSVYLWTALSRLPSKVSVSSLGSQPKLCWKKNENNSNNTVWYQCTKTAKSNNNNKKKRNMCNIRCVNFSAGQSSGPGNFDLIERTLTK